MPATIQFTESAAFNEESDHEFLTWNFTDVLNQVNTCTDQFRPTRDMTEESEIGQQNKGFDRVIARPSMKKQVSQYYDESSKENEDPMKRIELASPGPESVATSDSGENIWGQSPDLTRKLYFC